MKERKEMLQVPSPTVLRNTVDRVIDPRNNLLLKTIYLTAARESEVVTKVTQGDLLNNRSQAYGVYLKWTMDHYNDKPVFLITEAIAKKKAKTKTGEKKIEYKFIALPVEEKYDYWTKDLMKAVRNGGNLNFDIQRRQVQNIVTKFCIRDLGIPEEDVAHTKNILRHFRINHLITEYEFNSYDIATYAGHSLQTSFGIFRQNVSPSLSSYAHLQWRDYFPKLLKPILPDLYNPILRPI